MAIGVSHTSVNCSNAFELSEWWKALLGYGDVPGDPNEPGDEECMIVDPASGHRLLFIEFQPNGEGGCTYRAIAVHLDPAGREQHEEMGFLEGWGTVFDQLVEHLQAA